MKASELIKKLIDKLAEHGDMPVFYGTENMGQEIEFNPRFIAGEIEETSDESMAMSEDHPDRFLVR